MRKLNNITLVSDERFNELFQETLGRNALDPIEDTYVCTMRILELKKAWDAHLSLEAALCDMAVICYDDCIDEDTGDFIVPVSFYGFCLEVFTAFSHVLED